MNITISDSDSNEVQDSMRITKDRKIGCPFCEIPKQRILEEDELCYVIRDGFPVTDLHTLVIPKRHVETYFDLYQPELNSCNRMIQKFKQQIEKEDESVKGFNIGINNGEVAGQTVFHCHIHLILEGREMLRILKVVFVESFLICRNMGRMRSEFGKGGIFIKKIQLNING